MLIDRDKAIEAIDEVRDLISVEAYCAITERLKKLPSAERTGYWEVFDGMVICSECGEPNRETDYCPNCGARMGGEEE